MYLGQREDAIFQEIGVKWAFLEQLNEDHGNIVEITTSGKPKCILQRLIIKYNPPSGKFKRIG